MSKEKIVDSFADQHILVLGDIMLDKFIWGSVDRISPEAPVQIVAVEKETYAPGGAANVANNIAALGAQVSLAGFCGNDEACKSLDAEFEKRGIHTAGVVRCDDMPTIQKIRVLGKGQQLLRVDYEKKGHCCTDSEQQIIDYLTQNIDSFTAIAVSDYAKGVVSERIIATAKQCAAEKNIPLIVDPKPENIALYTGATVVTPNHHEAHKMSGVTEEYNSNIEIEDMGKQLSEQMEASILITRGEKGMSIFEKGKGASHIPTYAREVFDIVGAGDTVVAALSLALGCKQSLKDAADIANHAAGIVVTKVGTATVEPGELKKSLAGEL